jgi:hypothetical protein
LGAIHFSLDPRLVQALRTTLTLPVFLESGTYRGDTASAAAALFEQVYTVELSSELYAQAEARFASLANVSRRLGDSPQVISELAPQLASQSVFVLARRALVRDSPPEARRNECPLLSELRAIGTLKRSVGGV